MYVGTCGPATANIMLVGKHPGEEESRTGKPFAGTAGRILDQLLSQAGLSRHECLITNVAREQPPGNRIEFFFEDKKCTKPKLIMQQYMETLKKEIKLYRPNIVVALGRTALYALTGLTSIQEYRGYITESTLVPGQKVLATYHPEKVSYEWKLHFPTVMDLRKAVKESLTPNMPKDKRVLNATPSKREFIEYIRYLINDHDGPVAADIETKMPGSHVDILGLADSPLHALSMEIVTGKKARFSQSEELEIWQWVAQLATKKEVIFHNGLYDTAVMAYNNNIIFRRYVYDTLIATHICWPECPRSLAFVSSICLNVPAWKQTQSLLPTLYNAADAANTYGCWEVMKEELTKQNAWNTFNFEMSQVEVATMLQLQGISVDEETRQKLITEAHESITSLDEKVEKALGKKINLGSPKQLQNVLYVDLGLPVQYERRKSQQDAKTITANAKALQHLRRSTDNPVLDDILAWKKHTKLLNFLEIEISPEGKVHTCYNITGATMARENKGIITDDEDQYKSFGRWSSSSSIILPYGSGNFQNIPYKARKMYRAPKGYVILQADYMQAEAVAVAFLINDKPLKKMFRDSFGISREERNAKGYDVHKLTASMMFNIPIEDVTKEDRTVGKTIRHATNYSAGPGVLANKLGCSMAQGRKLLDIYNNACPQLHIWHVSVQGELRQTRMLTNLLGRKHKFLERWGDSLFRSAYSFVPQSTVGDLMNKSLVLLYQRYGHILDILLQLHDAVYVLIPESQIEFAMKAMRECMIHPLVANGEEFFIDVDFSYGPSWGEMTEI